MIEDPRLQLLLNLILSHVDAAGNVCGEWWRVLGAGWAVTVLLGQFSAPDGMIVTSSGSWLWEILVYQVKVLACLSAQVHAGDVLELVAEMIGCVHIPVVVLAAELHDDSSFHAEVSLVGAGHSGDHRNEIFPPESCTVSKSWVDSCRLASSVSDGGYLGLVETVLVINWVAKVSVVIRAGSGCGPTCGL